ncbi:hypothetical protein AAHA92_27029 [Salvia divinorum]|uniref:Uncharacterized protein n=1 Tax=Salvia divinorum TaxID=28513 RepID=A0ABD1G3I4_SALDI
MNDSDVYKQIQAEEKASDISVSAEKEFNIEKLQLVKAEKLPTELPTLSELELSAEISADSDLELVDWVDSVPPADNISPAANAKLFYEGGHVVVLDVSIPNNRRDFESKFNINIDECCFSDFHLEDKLYFNRGGVDTDIYSTSSNFLHNPL